MNFTDHKVSTWLAASFGLLVLLGVATGILALRELATVEANLEDVVLDNNVKTMRQHDHGRIGACDLPGRALSVVLLEDKAAKEREMPKIAKARAEYDKAWEELQKFPASETGQAIRAKTRQASEVARPLNNRGPWNSTRRASGPRPSPCSWPKPRRQLTNGRPPSTRTSHSRRPTTPGSLQRRRPTTRPRATC